MFVKTICAFVMVAAAAVVGCSSDGHNEGGACAKNDDCGGNLACQPITGRQGAYCCPAPADSSKEANCQAK